MPEKLCLSVHQLAEQLGVSHPIAYEIVKRNDFPSITIGRRIIIPYSGLEKWLAEQSVSGRLDL